MVRTFLNDQERFIPSHFATEKEAAEFMTESRKHAKSVEYKLYKVEEINI